MASRWDDVLVKLDDYRWQIPKSYKQGMLVPGIVYSDEEMMRQIVNDQSLEQVANVAFLPGIVEASIAMPDIHWGYGFPVGGVAATRVKDGAVSPGGVGFDINCGVRLLRTDLVEGDVRPKLRELVDALFANIPSGVGSAGKLRLRGGEMDDVLAQGARWAVARGLGDQADLDTTEEGGCIKGADPQKVGKRPKERGTPQLGTLGSGNHFLEVQAVDQIFEPKLAAAMGIRQVGQVTILIHCGSRGLGHQVCDDYLRVMEGCVKKYGYQLPDRQLAAAPVQSQEGKDYIAAMYAAANFAWANRQCIAHWTRETLAAVLGRSWESMGIRQVYDVCHNIAKIEEHKVGGWPMSLCIHRKGATRAFPPGHPAIPEAYRAIGQPVLIPGDMGRYSFLAVGTQGAYEGTFGSTAHGAGRTQSRAGAKRLLKGVDIAKKLEEKGIIVKATSWSSLAEEDSIAYKDVASVVEVAQRAGIARKVARMKPLGVIKG